MKLCGTVNRRLRKRNSHKKPVTEEPVRTTVAQNNSRSEPHTITQISTRSPVPLSDWTGLSVSKKELKGLKESKESKDLERRIKRQKARHAASISDELQRYQRAKLFPTIVRIIDRPATSLEYGTLDALPMELILMIMKELPTESLALLALTNTTYMGLVDRPPWKLLHESKHKVLGKAKDSLYFRFLCALEKDFQRAPAPMYFCSDCVAFHRPNHFADSQLRESSQIRVCDAAIGVVNLAPHATLTWSKMQDIPNNTVTKLTRTIESKYIPFPRWLHRSYLEQNRIRIKIEILKKDGMVCVETRWEMSCHKVYDLVMNFMDIQRKPNECPGWLCPHNNIVNLRLMWRMWKMYCLTCPGNTDPHSFLDFVHCHNLRPLKCIACSTDMEHEIEIQPDTTRARYVMTTWRILGRDSDHTSREWRSQCRSAYDCLPMEHYQFRNWFWKNSVVRRTVQELRSLREGRHYRMPNLWDIANDIQPCPGCGMQIAPTDATWIDATDSLTNWHARCQYRASVRGAGWAASIPMTRY